MHRSQVSSRIRWVVCLLLLVGVGSGLPSASALWDEQAGDNTNLMQMFMPPEQAQQQQQPSGLDQWQAQQAGMPSQQQQQQQQPASMQSILAGVAALLQAAAAVTAPQQQQQQQPQQSMFSLPQQDGNMNLYGAHPSPPAAGDTALLSTHSSPSQAEDSILPLAAAGTSAYGFSVPPADVQAKLRRALPKKVSDVDLFGRISRRASGSNNNRRSQLGNKLINLEQQFRQAPDLPMPAHKQRRVFHLSTRHHRRAPLPPTGQQANQRAEQEQKQNPFSAALMGTIDQEILADNPALIALQEAEAALNDADSSMDMSNLQSAAAASPSASQDAAAAPAADADDVALMETSSQSKASSMAALHAEYAHPHAAEQSDSEGVSDSEFAQPAVPSSDFSQMFRSIMRSRQGRGGRSMHPRRI